MTIFAHIDAEGRPLGFYASEIHGAAMPPEAIEISAETHAAWILDTARQRWDGAALVACDPPAPPPPTEAQQRRRRDALLAASDWTQVGDAPLATEARAAWATYRQALRDVPEQSGFPADIAWPNAPG